MPEVAMCNLIAQNALGLGTIYIVLKNLCKRVQGIRTGAHFTVPGLYLTMVVT